MAVRRTITSLVGNPTAGSSDRSWLLHWLRYSNSFTYWIPTTNSTEQSASSDTDSHSAGQKIPRLLWKPKAHWRVHKYPLLVPLLSQMNPISSRYVLLLPFQRPGSLPCGPLQLFRRIFRIYFLFCHLCYMPRPSHPSSFNHASNLRWEIKNYEVLYYVISSILRYIIWNLFILY